MTRIKDDFEQFNMRLFNLARTEKKGIITQQRIIVFIYSSIILMAGIILNLCGIVGPSTLFFQMANLAHGLLTVLVFVLYYHRQMTLTTAMSLFCIIAQVEISAEIVYCAIHNTTYDVILIIGNIMMSATVLLLGIMAYLRTTPYVVASLAMLTFAWSIYMTEREVLENFFLVFLLVFTMLSFIGWTLTTNMTKLEKENSNLKQEQREILNVFNLSKEQMQSYMALSQNNDLLPDKTSELLNSIGNEAEKTIRKNVTYYLKQSAIEFDQLKERLPELSSSELEICSLVLKEKKLKEICKELDKSPSNITCQRTHIRTKLGLRKNENLYWILKRRMEKTDKS